MENLLDAVGIQNLEVGGKGTLDVVNQNHTAVEDVHALQGTQTAVEATRTAVEALHNAVEALHNAVEAIHKVAQAMETVTDMEVMRTAKPIPVVEVILVVALHTVAIHTVERLPAVEAI